VLQLTYVCIVPRRSSLKQPCLCLYNVEASLYLYGEFRPKRVFGETKKNDDFRQKILTSLGQKIMMSFGQKNKNEQTCLYGADLSLCLYDAKLNLCLYGAHELLMTSFGVFLARQT
jgi:hypothetical protein